MSLALPLSRTLSLPSRTSSPSATATATPAHASGYAAGVAPGCVNSTDILRGQKAVEISHNGSTYRLQATRLGKLILTK